MSADARTFTPPAAIPAVAAFDRIELLGRLEGDLELMRELVGMFRTDLPDMVSALQSAVEAQDFARLERAAHYIKGTLLNLAAGPAARLALRLELAGRGKVSEETGTTLASLKDELGRLESALSAEHAVEVP